MAISETTVETRLATAAGDRLGEAGVQEARGRFGVPLQAGMAEVFECRVSWVGHAVILAVVGAVDIVTAPVLERSIESVRETARRVVVDLSAVSYLDAWALNALVDCHNRIAGQDVEFRVVCPVDRFVCGVFEISHLTEPLRMFESCADALAEVDHDR